MRERDPGDDDSLEEERPFGLRRALAETAAVLRLADAAYRGHGCPSSAECCQLSKTGREPWLWRTEWQLLIDRLTRDGRPLPSARADGGCPFLDPAGQRCTVYEDRPFGCRTFFCHRRTGPAREPIERVDALLRRLKATALEAFADDEPRPLTRWWASAQTAR